MPIAAKFREFSEFKSGPILLLAELAPHQQETVELAMANNPALSLAETLEELNAFGL